VGASIQYEGLREIAQALKETDKSTLAELTRDLKDVGEVVEHEAVHLFDPYDPRSAAGFDTRVRVNTSTMALVSVGQSLPKTTGLRPDWGTLQVEVALLPARDRKWVEANKILEDGAIANLRRHGIT
jgi:hypothetical protein